MDSLCKVIILLGPPGSGKGTQASLIAKTLGIPHISTGDLFRENIKNQWALGIMVKAIIDKGNLVPDALVIDMLFDFISKPICNKGYLLDGFPRTLQQAAMLDAFLKDRAEIIVRQLNVPDEAIIKRIEGRQTCSNCGNMHNRYFSPSIKPDTCDKCQGPLIQRPDDNLQVVKERLIVYHEQTKPLIRYYENMNKLKSIDGLLPQQQVYQDLILSI